MALSSTDLFLLQRSGSLRRTTIGELNAKMQDTDIILVQRGSPGTCRQTTWSNTSSLQDADILVVGNGGTIKKTTWSAVKGFLTLEKTIVAANNNTSANQNVSAASLFTAAEASSNTDKVITIESGAVVGATSTSNVALTVSGLSGNVTIINNGTIIGAGGAGGSANSGTGGNGGKAFTSSINVTLVNNGTISGGGGGGGGGGRGGSGTTNTNYGPAYPANRESCKRACEKGYSYIGDPDMNCCSCQVANAGWDDVCNTCCKTVAANGTNGGAGGSGAGYNQSNAGGSAGANASGTVGKGGTGGTGGTVGDTGGTGSVGANGSTGNGSNGGAGGSAGAATHATAGTISLTNSGTINGPQI